VISFFGLYQLGAHFFLFGCNFSFGDYISPSPCVSFVASGISFCVTDLSLFIFFPKYWLGRRPAVVLCNVISSLVIGFDVYYLLFMVILNECFFQFNSEFIVGCAMNTNYVFSLSEQKHHIVRCKMDLVLPFIFDPACLSI